VLEEVQVVRLPAFEYHEPATVEEAVALLQQHGENARMMAGGTDVLPALKGGKYTCSHVIGMKDIAGLGGIEFRADDGLRIGAACGLTEAMEYAAVPDLYPAFRDSIHDLATVQVRNKGTVVGNLCNASPAADTATPLMAYGSVVTIVGPDGRREMPLERFITGPGRTALQAGELIEYVTVPVPSKARREVFLKYSHRSKVDIAAVIVTAVMDVDDGIVADPAIFLGTVAPVPMRAAAAAQAVVGKTLDEPTIAAAAAAAREEARPITDFRATEQYKRHMVEVLTRRALEAIASRS
jgi:carbon-monoxide dehydrogenase medium subunit